MKHLYSPNYEDYAELADQVPVLKSFEDWTRAAQDYALDNHTTWNSEKIIRFASDIAWLMEGVVITPEELDKAAKNWQAGRNPYNKAKIYE